MALAVVTIAVDGLPIIPIGFAISAVIIWRHALDVRTAVKPLLGSFVFFLVGLLVIQLSFNVPSGANGNAGGGIIIRSFGGLKAWSSYLQKRAFLQRPRWIAYPFEACRRPDGTLSRISGCEETLEVPANTPFETTEFERQGEYPFTGKIQLAGVTHSVQLGVDPRERFALVTDASPQKRRSALSEAYDQAKEQGKLVAGMTPHDVKTMRGMPTARSFYRLGKEVLIVYTYREGPVLVFGGPQRALRHIFSKQEREYERQAAEKLQQTFRKETEAEGWRAAPVWEEQAMQLYAGHANVDGLDAAALKQRGQKHLRRAAQRYTGKLPRLKLKYPPTADGRSYTLRADVAELQKP